MAITLFAVTFIVFMLNELTPGDVVRKLLGPYANADQVEKVTREMGLDRPVMVRYLEYMANAARGDFGQSIVFRKPVSEVLWDRLGNTLILAGVCFAVIVPFSVLLGVLAGMRERSWIDRTVSVFSSICASIPEFAHGRVPAGDLRRPARLAARHLAAQRRYGGWPIWTQLVLPVTVVVLYDAGYLIAMIRTSMVEVMRQPFIRTAVLKGMSFRDVVVKHALRNALIAPFTVILLQLNYLVAGLVVVEMVFAYPGFGRMMLEAALAKDIAIVEAGTLVAVFVTMLTQIVGDLGYRALDPRITI